MPYRDPGVKKARDAARYAANKEKAKACRAERRMTPEGRARMLVTSAITGKNRAPFRPEHKTAIIQYVTHQIELGVCQQTGVPFVLGPPPSGMSRHPSAPSIDRIDNSRGYELGNVQTVTAQYNMARGELPVDAFEQWVLAYANLIHNRSRR